MIIIINGCNNKVKLWKNPYDGVNISDFLMPKTQQTVTFIILTVHYYYFLKVSVEV